MPRTPLYIVLDGMRRNSITVFGLYDNIKDAHELATNLRVGGSYIEPQVLKVDPGHRHFGRLDWDHPSPYSVGFFEDVHLLLRGVPHSSKPHLAKVQCLGVFSTLETANLRLSQLTQSEYRAGIKPPLTLNIKPLTLRVDEHKVTFAKVYSAGGLDPFWTEEMR